MNINEILKDAALEYMQQRGYVLGDTSEANAAGIHAYVNTRYATHDDWFKEQKRRSVTERLDRLAAYLKGVE